MECIYIKSLNPHTNPLRHIIVTPTNIPHVITITIWQLREPRHREHQELPKIVNCCWWRNRDSNPGSLIQKASSLYIQESGVWCGGKTLSMKNTEHSA